MSKMDSFLCDSHVQSTVRFHAKRLVKFFPSTVTYEDAVQEIYAKLAKHADGYDPKKGARSTYTIQYARSLFSHWNVSKRKHWHEQHLRHVDAGSSRDPQVAYNIRVEYNVAFDQIEKKLKEIPNKRAYQVFVLLRKGFNKAEIANALNVTRSCISNIINRHIKSVVNMYAF